MPCFPKTWNFQSFCGYLNPAKRYLNFSKNFFFWHFDDAFNAQWQLMGEIKNLYSNLNLPLIVYNREKSSMSIRYKVLLIIVPTFIALIFLMFFLTQKIILLSFAELEKDYLKKNIERALSTFNVKSRTLESFTADWAAWDDTYKFIEDKNEAYIIGVVYGRRDNGYHVNNR